MYFFDIREFEEQLQEFLEMKEQKQILEEKVL